MKSIQLPWVPTRLTCYVFVTTMVFGCGNVVAVPEVFELTMRVEGTVVDVTSDVPIENAQVEVRTTNTGVLFTEVMSDSVGGYSLSFLYRYFATERIFCPFAYLVSAAGYATEAQPINCIEELQTVDFALQPF